MIVIINQRNYSVVDCGKGGVNSSQFIILFIMRRTCQQPLICQRSQGNSSVMDVTSELIMTAKMCQ